MYVRPTATSLSNHELTDLLGPVETQYNIELAQCGGCDELNVTMNANAIVQVQVIAPNCDGNITGFNLSAVPGQQGVGTTNGGSVNQFIPVGSGTFNGDVWTANTNIVLPFFGNVDLSVDVINGMTSTGPLCTTTAFIPLRD